MNAYQVSEWLSISVLLMTLIWRVGTWQRGTTDSIDRLSERLAATEDRLIALVQSRNELADERHKHLEEKISDLKRSISRSPQ